MAEERSTGLSVERLPLIVEPENRDTSTSKDARLVNCFIEISSGPKGKELHVFKRPGLVTSTQPSGGAATGRGIYNWKGNIYSVFGATLYKDTTSKGTVNATNGVYRWSQILGATPKVQLGDGVKAYNYDDVGGLVNINDADFPAAFVKGWAYLDQTTYVMDASANIQGSGLNDTVNWDPLNTVQAQIEPDGGVALGKQLVNVIALKQWTAEVFYDAGNATGSPLGRVPGAKANWGCAHQDSLQDVDGLLYWLATTKVGARAVVRMDALAVNPVSTPAVDRLLEGWDLTTVYSWGLKAGKHKFYGLTSKVSNMTLVFDISQRMWSQWTDANGNYWPIVSSAADASQNALLQHESNGKIYKCNLTTTNDDGTVFPVDIYTPNWDAGDNVLKYLPKMEVIADQQPGFLQVRSSDDDYQTWSNFRTVDLSVPRPYLTDCGSFNERAYHLRYRGNTSLRIRALDMHVMRGSM